MNDKTAHKKLKELTEKNSGYKNSRRERNNNHEDLNKGLTELEKLREKSGLARS